MSIDLTVEQQVEDQKRRQREAEAKVKRVKEGIPSEEQERLSEAEAYLKVTEALLEHDAFKRVSQLLEMTRSLETVTEALNEFRFDLKEQGDTQTTVSVYLQEVISKIQQDIGELKQRMMHEFDEQDRERDAKRETRALLDAYLKKWV